MTPSSWITPKAAKGVDSAIAGRGLVDTEAISTRPLSPTSTSR
jgi:hypothetical protein